MADTEPSSSSSQPDEVRPLGDASSEIRGASGASSSKNSKLNGSSSRSRAPRPGGARPTKKSEQMKDEAQIRAEIAELRDAICAKYHDQALSAAPIRTMAKMVRELEDA